MQRRSSFGRTVAAILLLVGLVALERLGVGEGLLGDGVRSDALLPTGAAADRSDRAAGTRAILEAYRNERSGLVVESEGTVEAVLRDDNHGSRHQRFILRLDPEHTVLVSHNIDLAPRVEGIGRGDSVRFRGQYEWTERGGVVHWTHHDPDRRRKGGWIEHQGRTYR